jgi:hypothetical protein
MVNWEAIGAAAELLGAGGVILSLFYLASQIRHNSESVEAATALAISGATQQRLLVPAQSAELAAAIRKAFDGAPLADAEQTQVEFFTRASFRGIENAYFQHQRGMISTEAFRAYDALLRTNIRLGVVGNWWFLERQTFAPGFREIVDRLMDEMDEAVRPPG